MTKYSPAATATKRRSIGRGLAQAGDRLENMATYDLEILLEADFLDKDELELAQKQTEGLKKISNNLRIIGRKLDK